MSNLINYCIQQILKNDSILHLISISNFLKYPFFRVKDKKEICYNYLVKIFKSIFYQKLYHYIKDKFHLIVITFLSDKNKFTYIYKNQYWLSFRGKSLSGTGSDIESTKELARHIQAFIHDYKITSIFDVPCGDWEWMKTLKLEHLKYTGADIVSEIIENNNKKFKSNYISFKVCDLRSDQLVNADLLIVRDLFFHLKLKDIQRCLDNIKKYKFKYIALTNYPECHTNNDTFIGDRWRPINLTKSPFLLKSPALSLSDPSSPNAKKTNKQLSIWEYKDIY